MKKTKIECPYINTIRKDVLDFDLFFQCAICLSEENIYCCLICGKFLEGIGCESHAYTHALENEHYLFINTETQDIFCVPDNYKVIEEEIEDIKFNLRPYYSQQDIETLESDIQKSRALNGNTIITGLIPINNLKSSVYANCAIYLLFQITEIRHQILLNFYSGVTKLLGDICRKMWNAKSFKNNICPYEFFKEIEKVSKGKFTAASKSDPQDFFQWLLHILKLEGFLKKGISKSLQGKLEQNSSSKAFMHFKLDLPINSPFEEFRKTISINTILSAYLQKHQITILKPPKYLLLFFKKFQDNGFFIEKSKFSLEYSLELNFSTKPYTLISSITLEPDSSEKAFYFNTLHINQWYTINDLSVSPLVEQSVSEKEPYMLLYKQI